MSSPDMGLLERAASLSDRRAGPNRTRPEGFNSDGERATLSSDATTVSRRQRRFAHVRLEHARLRSGFACIQSSSWPNRSGRKQAQTWCTAVCRDGCGRSGSTRFAHYLDQLEGDPQFTAQERQEFVNALTTNLTSFFREKATIFRFFRISSRVVWPARPARISGVQPPRPAKNPTPIAMTAIEALGANSDARILATDIDTQVLGLRGGSGVYQGRGRAGSAARSGCAAFSCAEREPTPAWCGYAPKSPAWSSSGS